MTTQRIAAVTGAASGLGAACARRLSDAGHAVVLIDRAPDGLREVAAELRAAGGEVRALRVDLADELEVAAAFEEIAALGRLVALVNAAGVSALGTIDELEPAEWDRIVGIKLRGQYLTCRQAIRQMQAGGGGAIVNVSSVSGRTKSIFTSPAYAAANAGIIGLTMTTAAQAAPFGVRVNCVAPGVIDTPMLRMYGEEHVAAMARAIPLGRIADPVEVAAVIAFLLSDAAGYVTGETVNVNGGLFMM